MLLRRYHKVEEEKEEILDAGIEKVEEEILEVEIEEPINEEEPIQELPNDPQDEAEALYDELTLNQLKELAAERQIKVPNKIKKAELIKLLK